jgi:hypothetical protein
MGSSVRGQALIALLIALASPLGCANATGVIITGLIQSAHVPLEAETRELAISDVLFMVGGGCVGGGTIGAVAAHGSRDPWPGAAEPGGTYVGLVFGGVGAALILSGAVVALHDASPSPTSLTRTSSAR